MTIDGDPACSYNIGAYAEGEIVATPSNIEKTRDAWTWSISEERVIYVLWPTEQPHQVSGLERWWFSSLIQALGRWPFSVASKPGRSDGHYTRTIPISNEWTEHCAYNLQGFPKQEIPLGKTEFFGGRRPPAWFLSSRNETSDIANIDDICILNTRDRTSKEVLLKNFSQYWKALFSPKPSRTMKQIQRRRSACIEKSSISV